MALDSNSAIVALIRKKMDGTISEQELTLLKKWEAENVLHTELLKKTEEEETVLADIRSWMNLRADNDVSEWNLSFQEKTMAKIHRAKRMETPTRRLSWRKFASYAAIFIAILGFAFWMYQTRNINHKPIVIADIAPGSNKATITLDDGAVIELREDRNGVVLGDQLEYEDGTTIQALNKDKVSFATITTPRGGQYQITLSDGTKVWINADSELKYPSSFGTESRIVELKGEAYFDVAKSTKNGKNIPFIVKTTQQKVEVLGTQFNLKAYIDELQDVRTTLVEGAVKLHAEKTTLTLSPGEQGIQGKLGLSKRKVDLGPYIAWKNNQFVFEETELREALKVLSRWYDFDYEVDSKIKPTHLYASINRSKSIKQVLNIIESSGIKCKLENLNGRNKLTIFN